MFVKMRLAVAVLLTVAAGLSVALVSISATGQEKKSTPRATDRTLAEAIRSSDRATVADGFVIRLYTNDEADENQQRASAHNKLYNEYATKLQQLRLRERAINSKVPLSQVLQTAASTLQRYDTNRDGVLTVKELDSRRLGKETDQDNDGVLSHAELVRWVAGNRSGLARGRGAGGFAAGGSGGGRFGAAAGATDGTAGGPTVKEIAKLIKEHATIEKEKAKLLEQYKDVRGGRYRSKTYYRIVEMSKEFLRLRSKREERIIPIASIKEFRRSLPKDKQ